MTLDSIDGAQNDLSAVDEIEEGQVIEVEAKIPTTEATGPQAASPSTPAAIASGPTLPMIPNSADADQLGLPIEQDLPRPFDCVSSDLAALGALSIEDFLSNVTSSTAIFDVNFYVQLPEASVLTEKLDMENGEIDGATVALDGQTKADEQRTMRGMIEMLHEASNKIFGSSDCLKFEYMEEDTMNRQCILTITRPNGATRSYTSDPNAGFTRRQDARMQAAKIAVEMGAIDFITSGDADALKAKKGFLLNPFDVEIDNEMSEMVPGMSKYTEEEEPLKWIEDACGEWRAGRVKPHWVTYNDSKNKKKHGAALRISLNAHVFRSYSVDPVYTYQRLAKVACARSAVKEGVIDFIKYGNGQTQPAKAEPSDGSEGDGAILRELTPPPPPKGITLQEFFDTLPRPFPENIRETTASEFNAPAWLNLTLQSARGGRLVSSYTPIVDGVRHLHGCILRIERPGETRTYLVDPQFPKRSDARCAVCLLAMSQGVGSYIRGLKEEAENKLPAERRKLANEKLIQTLSYECSKVKPGNRLIFTFSTERDAFGCTLKADISSDRSDVREYTVNTEFRNKADAKAAVACLAAEQGLVDLLRFRGGPFPSDYTPFWDAQVHGNGDHYYIAKRKDRDRDFDGEGQDRKRRKGNFRDRECAYELEMHYLRSKVKVERPSENGAFLFRPPTGPSAKNSWKIPRVSGSSGLEPTNGYNPSSRTVGQDRTEYRTSGASQNSRSHSVQPPTAPRALLNSISSSAARRYQSHGNQRAVATESQPRSQNAHTSQQVATTHSPSSAPVVSSRSDQYSQSNSHTQTGVDAHGQSYPCSQTYVQSAAYPTTYTTDPYPQPNTYGPAYSSYPPPVISHYPSAAYPTPPPTHGYATYYVPPSSGSYSHYVHAHPTSYAPYPNGQYPVYSSHPAHFSPPPPPPPHVPHMIMPPAYPSPGMHASSPPVPYSSGYHSPYSPPYSPAYPVSLRSPPRSPPAAGYSYHEHNNQQYSILDPHSQQNGVQDHITKPETSDASPPEVAFELTPAVDAQIKQEPLNDQQLSSALTKEAPPNSNLAALYEFCRNQNTTSPKFMFEVVKDQDGDKKFKVWAEQYSQRLELPTLFSNYEDGREKLAKRVLNWMRKRS